MSFEMLMLVPLGVVLGVGLCFAALVVRHQRIANREREMDFRESRGLELRIASSRGAGQGAYRLTREKPICSKRFLRGIRRNLN
jgi:hypothetical protein